MRRLRIGTRGSKLAMWQARRVRELLRQARAGLEADLSIIHTRGDRLPAAVAAPGPEGGLFTAEIERALLEGRVDLAVHSLKDLPTRVAEGSRLAAFPERADAADALVARGGLTLESLPRGATVLTGSPRRRALLLHSRPDLNVEPVQGNVETRLRKLDELGADALMLACAGLERLGLSDRVAERLDPERFPPACGQGALVVQARADDEEVLACCAAVDDTATRLAVTAERAYLAALGGGCRVPVGAFGRFEGDAQQMALSGMLADPGGTGLLLLTVRGRAATDVEAAELGRRLAGLMRGQGGRRPVVTRPDCPAAGAGGAG